MNFTKNNEYYHRQYQRLKAMPMWGKLQGKRKALEDEFKCIRKLRDSHTPEQRKGVERWEAVIEKLKVLVIKAREVA